jgi:hypothetical protein
MKLRRLLPIALAAALLAGSSLASAARLAPPDTRFKLVLARVVTRSGERRLLVRVNGPTRTVKVRVVLARSNGKILVGVTRAIRTNRRLLVPRLAIPRRAREIHVKILGHVG